jgi:hypothetical protein
MNDDGSGQREREAPFQPLAYHDKELEGMIGHRVLNDHMGLHDVLGVLIDAVAKRGKDYNLCHEVRYTLTAGPITLAKGISRFLVWWNDARARHLCTLYRYRTLSKSFDCRVLSSRSIKHLSKLREYGDIETWLMELTTRNQHFMFRAIFSWKHVKRLTS